MTDIENQPETGLNLREPQYAGWRSADENSARNFRREVLREDREALRQNQVEHEDLRARVDRLERDMEMRKPVIDAASDMVSASRVVKTVIVVIAVILSVLTGFVQIFDRWLQK
jgi:hypothetical protein